MFIYSFHACMSGYITYKAPEVCFAKFSPHGSNFSSLYVMFMLQSSRLVLKPCYFWNPRAVMVAVALVAGWGQTEWPWAQQTLTQHPPHTHTLDTSYLAFHKSPNPAVLQRSISAHTKEHIYDTTNI